MRPLSTVLQVVLGVVMLLSAGVAVLALVVAEYGLLSAEQWLVSLEFVTLSVFVVAGLLWIVWSWRGQVNTRLITLDAFKPIWAVGVWLPILNIWMPHSLIARQWGAATTGVAEPGSSPWWMRVWWTIVVGMVVGNRMLPDEFASPSDYATFLRWYALVLGLQVIGALLAVVVVRRVSAAIEERGLRP